ncbi:hypothetical protein HG263_02385 [Pseudoalteromonas sp. JBTF-M23]|uniref:Inner membrane protein n=1 Tax=Pseudoalteromonas caenipelagi TaxID=2726988 RepID=A0A849V9U2_9GAMM|nr:hypothetical protein [Pseudoalteromonas caenipelagi]NOU49393.1 hypothetical protein [Pseudoalteromonas caenipelagi]
MGNLFLQERERWWIWFMWGLVGCLLSSFVLSLTHQQIMGFTASSLLVLAVAIWMNYSKRFEFFRAFKVLILIYTFSFLPPLLDALLPIDKLSVAALKGGLVLAFGMLLCIFCAWFARRPKQYY